eukprot:3852-Heterococcus_DN1.PRE.2
MRSLSASKSYYYHYCTTTRTIALCCAYKHILTSAYRRGKICPGRLKSPGCESALDSSRIVLLQ